MAIALFLLLQTQDADVALLQSRDPAVRAAAARTIGARGDQSAIPALIAALKDDVLDVKSAAHDALQKITGVTTLEPTFEAWDAWWNTEGKTLFVQRPGGPAALTSDVEARLESVGKEQDRLRTYINLSIILVTVLWLVFIIALIYFAGHLSSKLKEWKDVMKQAEQYLRESEEVTKRSDRIIDELEAKKSELVDFFSKLKDDNEGELERFADLLEQNTEHRIRLEVMALRQKAEKEMEQTVGELKGAADHEIRRAANEYRGRAERELEVRLKSFMAQIDLHTLFLEAAFFASQGRHEEALKIYKKLVESKPDHSIAWMHMANVLREMLRYDEALESYKRALELSPNDAKVHYNMAMTFARMKRRDSMLGELAKAFENNGEELKDEALNDPAFKPYWDDPAFKDLAEG